MPHHGAVTQKQASRHWRDHEKSRQASVPVFVDLHGSCAFAVNRSGILYTPSYRFRSREGVFFMDLTALFPQWRGLRITRACPEADHLMLVAHTTARTVSCPLCHQPAASIHSRYQRRVTDLPCGGRAVTLIIHARRFFCRTPTCSRRTFRERMPALVAPGARRSHPLLRALTKIGMALGGKPGARLARQLGMPTSNRTLLRHTSPEEGLHIPLRVVTEMTPPCIPFSPSVSCRNST